MQARMRMGMTTTMGPEMQMKMRSLTRTRDSADCVP